MDHFEENPMGNNEVSDATQRIRVDSSGRPSAPPSRRNTPATPPQRRRQKNNSRKRKQDRITLIALLSLVAVALIAVIIVVVMMLLPSSSDDGRIANNVYAAGINIGGMTKEQAVKALHDATDDTYTVLDMTVQVLDTEVTLAPAQTGARLDVDAVVDAALEYSRSNRKQNSTYTVSVVEHLHLNTVYIKGELDKLGEKYSTTLKQTTYEITGTRPSMELEDKDVTKVHQVLTIHLGTAEYGLNTNTLYQQILDAYNINLFQVTGKCSVNAPAALNYEALFAQYCVAPVNAEFNADTYEVTPEQYGYGFKLEDLKKAVESAEYGSNVTLDLCFIEPDITSAFYTGELFQDVLSTFQTALSDSPDWNINLQLVCDILNGTIVKSGEEFSFNDMMGEPTAKKGYKKVSVFVGRSYQELVGGGICQVSSTLYACALLADMDITDRTSHSYAPAFIQPGLDAEIYYGVVDFKFKNTTEQPIRIDAVIEGGNLVITLVGTDSRDYTVKITYEETKTKAPETVYTTMLENNPGGYKDGDVLSEGIVGRSVSIRMTKYSKETKEKLSEDLVSENYYAKRDQVVVKIQAEDPPVDPIDPTPPTPDESQPKDESTNED